MRSAPVLAPVPVRVPALASALVFWALAALLPACGGGGGSGSSPGSAVLITLDTTNPRALDVYGTDRGVTPNLAAFAAQCVVYENARSVAPLTLPSHASMHTGLYPPRHTVRDNGHLPLPASAETAAERARAAGCRTAAFVAAAVLASSYGLDQGFEVYDEPAAKTTELGDAPPERPAAEVTRAALEWLDGRRDGEPFFLWVHYFDPHAPYAPPPGPLARAKNIPYLGEVAAVDEALGELLERLAREPDYDSMTIVVVADHGEGLGRHGEPTHALFCYDSTIRVPLLVRAPGGERAGTRTPVLASVVDVAPTLLDGMGIGATRGVDGRSLLDPALLAGRGVYFESYFGYLTYGFSPLAGWAERAGKYLHGPSPEFFDPADTGEESNVFRPDDPRVERARAAIARVAEAPALERNAREARSPTSGADVRALGYAGVASAGALIPHPLEPTQLPAARERLDEYRTVREAPLLAAAGRRDEAIRRLQRVVAANPRNTLAHDVLGQLLIRAGRPREALGVLGAMVERGLERPILRQHRAEAHAALGEWPAALAELERAEELCPGDATTARLLTKVREAMAAAGVGPGGR